MEELIQTVEQVKETIYMTQCNDSQDLFMMPGKYLLASRALRVISQDDSQPIPYFLLTRERRDEVLNRYPDIEKIRFIQVLVERDLMTKVLQWIDIYVDTDIFSKEPQVLPKERDPRDKQFIIKHKDIFSSLLKAARDLEIPTLVTALVEYAEKQLRGNPSQEIKDAFHLG